LIEHVVTIANGNLDDGAATSPTGFDCDLSVIRPDSVLLCHEAFREFHDRFFAPNAIQLVTQQFDGPCPAGGAQDFTVKGSQHGVVLRAQDGGAR
jgi:hypothetical protein